MRRWLVLALFAALLALAGCDAGSASGAAQSTSARSTTSGTQITGPVAATVTPTTAAVTTPGAQQGTAEFCAAPPSVSAQLPTGVPGYPGAVLRLGHSSGGSGIYGLCTGDSVTTIARFYDVHLSANGWQQVAMETNASVMQVQASKGSAHVIVTVEPDAQLSGTTEIIILTDGL